jgi:hypothetical protein
VRGLGIQRPPLPAELQAMIEGASLPRPAVASGRDALPTALAFLRTVATTLEGR